jgi:protein gp37
VSVEDQKRADDRIPHLLATPAAVRFVSAEPLLGHVDLRFLQPRDLDTEIDSLRGTHGVYRPHGGRCARLDWVIAGGESGPKARPMQPKWARSLRDQCANSGVPFFFKQWGQWGWTDQLDDETVRQIDARHNLAGHPQYDGPWKLGKGRAGRELDGRTWDEFPEAWT